VIGYPDDPGRLMIRYTGADFLSGYGSPPLDVYRL